MDVESFILGERLRLQGRELFHIELMCLIEGLLMNFRGEAIDRGKGNFLLTHNTGKKHMSYDGQAG